MGANVWQRDTTGNGQGSSFKTGSAAAPHPARPGKRKLVWTKDQQDQPATTAASAPYPAAYRDSSAASTSSSQHDHFEKRARLNESLNVPHNGYHRGPEAPPQRRHSSIKAPPAETKQQQAGAASKDPAAVLERRQKEAELAELKRRIQEHEDQAAKHKACTASLACRPVKSMTHATDKYIAKVLASPKLKLLAVSLFAVVAFLQCIIASVGLHTSYALTLKFPTARILFVVCLNVCNLC